VAADSEGDRAVSVSTRQAGDAVVLKVSGHLDDLGADTLSEALDRVLAESHSRLIFDLSDVMFLGSSGLGQIMRAYQAVKNRQGYVRVVNPQPLIADVFRLTKLDRLLDIFPSVEEALKG